MFVATQFVTGLLLIHACWIYVYICGTVVQTPRFSGTDGTESDGSADALLRVVAASASGIAITGFLTFALGLIHLIYPASFLAWLAVLFVVFVAVGDSPLRARFWTVRLATLRRAISPAAILLYLIALVLALPAVLPETQSDPLYFYYVLAFEWAKRHEIFVDYWRRFPFYAFNWTLIDTLAFEFGWQDYIAFFPWLTGCLSLLGIYGFVASFGRRLDGLRTSPFFADLAGVLGALALALSPIYLRWMDTGMLDVPTGFFFLISAACLTNGFVSNWRPWIYHLVICAAFLMGLKITLFAFLPVFLIGAFSIASRRGLSRRATVGVLVALVVLMSPWYLKNFIQAGDPIAPVLNLAVGGVDSKWSKADMEGVLADLKANSDLVSRVRVPYDIVTDTLSNGFREYGATVILAAIVVPVFFVVFCLARGRLRLKDDRIDALFVFAALLTFAIAYWMQTSHLARYALLFYAALCAFVPAVALLVGAKNRRMLGLGLVILAIAALPSSAQAWSYVNGYVKEETSIGTYYVGKVEFLTPRIDGYRETQYVSDVLLRNTSSRRVYIVQDQQLDYFFAERGILAIGDWFGPERFSDLDSAIDHGAAVAYLHRFNVDAILVPGMTPSVPLDKREALFGQLRSNHFQEAVIPNSVFHIFFAPRIADSKR